MRIDSCSNAMPVMSSEVETSLIFKGYREMESLALASKVFGAVLQPRLRLE